MRQTVTPIMGSGPYQLDSYDIPSRIIYKRNPDYWGNDLAVNKGRNNFDQHPGRILWRQRCRF